MIDDEAAEIKAKCLHVFLFESLEVLQLLRLKSFFIFVISQHLICKWNLILSFLHCRSEKGECTHVKH